MRRAEVTGPPEPPRSDPRGEPPPARDAEAVVAEARAAEVRITRVMWCGNDGIVRSKGVTTERLRERMASGVGLTRAQPAQTARDRVVEVPGMGPVGEMRLRPDPGTFRVLPHAPRTAGVLADMTDLAGRPDGVCHREFLRRVEARLAGTGRRARIGFENEFVLAREGLDGWEPIDRTPCFSAAGAAAAQDFTDALLGALNAQSIAVDLAHAEGGWGQHEIALAPGPALRAADEQIFVRESLRNVARGMGLAASLGPMPFPGAAGNGMHIHLSLTGADGANALVDPAAADGLSEVARHFIGGLLAHLPGLCAITAPGAGSHLRLRPRSWCGAWTCWGHDNREAAVRVCSPAAPGREDDSLNIEFKPCDASTSPHLAVGALIVAGLDGIERGIDPPPPVDADPASLTDDARAAGAVGPLPGDPGVALDALEADEVLTAAMGDTLARSFIAVRREEWDADRGTGPDRLCRENFVRY
jgi:glutamine synthetase